MDCNAEAHKKHICNLRMEGLDDCLKSVTDNPTVKCKYCGAMANSEQFVCDAYLEKETPDVEGGR